MNKNKLIYIGLGLTSLLTYAMANVPHTFSANTVAKASEVNDNFSSLDNRITSLENKSGSKKNDATNSSIDNCDKSVFSYHYKHTPSNIGDEVTIGDDKYKIVAVPFEEFGSKEHYYIKYPSKLDKDGKLSSSVRLSYVMNSSSCYPDKIKNFPAKISFGQYSRSIFTRNNYNVATGKYENSMQVLDSTTAWGSVKINQTIIDLPYYPSSSKTLQKKVISTKQYDFRDDIDWQKLNIQNQLIENSKKFFNYIDIVKVEN